MAAISNPLLVDQASAVIFNINPPSSFSLHLSAVPPFPLCNLIQNMNGLLVSTSLTVSGCLLFKGFFSV